MFLSCFLFSMKHSYLSTTKTTHDVNNFLWFLHGMKGLLYAIFCMRLRSNFWHLIMASTKMMWYVYASHYFFKRNINHRFNFLFELTSNTMSLIGSYLLQSFKLLKRFLLLKTCIAKLIKYIVNTLIANLFMAWFRTCKKKLLSVISCRCPN